MSVEQDVWMTIALIDIGLFTLILFAMVIKTYITEKKRKPTITIDGVGVPSVSSNELVESDEYHRQTKVVKKLKKEFENEPK